MDKGKLKKCVARHCVTEERVDALTDGDKCYDLNGKPLDPQFAPDDPNENFRSLLVVIAFIALVSIAIFIWGK